MRGSIFHHEQLVFYDGEIGKKYLILLNSPQSNEPYLFVKTTSQKKIYPEHDTPKCLYDNKRFFIPANRYFFPKNTWVQLYEIYPFSAAEMLKSKFDNKLSKVGIIETQLVNQIVNCLINSSRDDILDSHVQLLLRDKTA